MAMMRKKQHIVAALIIFLYGLLVLATTYFFDLKKDALDFHTRDYAFYMETYARAFDSSRTSNLSIQPEGKNMFFMFGTDGAHGVHATIHFEPIKYAFSAVYQIAGVEGVFITFSALFWFPVIYTYIALRRFGLRRALLSVVTYVLVPWGIVWAARDVRPITLLAPSIAILSIGLLARRPPWELCVATLFLFSIREEAIIFSLPLIVVAYVTHRDAFRSIASVCAVGAAALAWYYTALVLGNFFEIPLLIGRSSVEILIDCLVVLLVLGVVVTFANAVRSKKMSDVFVPRSTTVHANLRMRFCVLCLPALVALAVVLFEGGGIILSDSRFLPVLWVSVWYVVTATALLSTHTASINVHGYCAIAVATVAVISAPSFLSQIAELHVRATQSYLPHRIANERAAENSKTVVLTDYAAHQAFVANDTVYTFDRLPSWMVEDGSRFWPHNFDVLVEMIHSGTVESVIVSVNRVDDIRMFAEATSVEIVSMVTDGAYVQIYMQKDDATGNFF
jgi:hypothetical protein